jgi:hypothetical protein
MKITQITLGRTINVGNYESVRFELTADVDPDDGYALDIAKLKDMLAIQEAQIRKEYTHRK